jgi:hypothetical protein
LSAGSRAAEAALLSRCGPRLRAPATKRLGESQYCCGIANWTQQADPIDRRELRGSLLPLIDPETHEDLIEVVKGRR